MRNAGPMVDARNSRTGAGTANSTTMSANPCARHAGCASADTLHIPAVPAPVPVTASTPAPDGLDAHPVGILGMCQGERIAEQQRPDWEPLAAELAARSLAGDDPIGWFERISAAGRSGTVSMPWGSTGESDPPDLAREERRGRRGPNRGGRRLRSGRGRRGARGAGLPDDGVRHRPTRRGRWFVVEDVALGTHDLGPLSATTLVSAVTPP
jgi:hypothetical protein